MDNFSPLNSDQITKAIDLEIEKRHPNLVEAGDDTWYKAKATELIDRLNPEAVTEQLEKWAVRRYKERVDASSNKVGDKMRELANGQLVLSFELGLANHIIKVPTEPYEENKRSPHKKVRVAFATVNDWMALEEYERAAAAAEKTARDEKCEGYHMFWTFIRDNGLESYGEGLDAA